MKKLFYLSSLIFLFNLNSSAQDITRYSFSALSGTYTPLSSSTSTLGALASGTNNEGIYNLAPIGFDFFYLGERFNTIQASTNGWASLGANTQGSSVAANSFTSFSAPSFLLAPLWDDLDMASGSFRYQTTGSAPNRIFIAEWQNVEWNWNTNAPVISFQLKLFETTGAIQFEYKQETNNVSGGSASIGIKGSNGSNNIFQSLNGTGSSPSTNVLISTNNLNTRPANGQIYRFICSSVNQPLNFATNGITFNNTNLNWSDNSSNETAFIIYRSIDNVNFQFLTNRPSNVGSAQITNLISGTTYFYRIFALNEGRLSNPLSGSATTQAGTIGGTLNIPGNYPTLTAALNALRTSGIASNTILQLNPTYNSLLETYPINIAGIGTSATRTLTIRPASNVTNLTITSTIGIRAFLIDNTSFVTIDGRPGGVGTNRALTIACPNGTNTVLFGDDCNNDTLRFCRVSLNDNGQGSFPFSSVISFSTFAQGYINGSNNNAVLNNEIFGINQPNCLITFQGTNQFSIVNPISIGNSFNNNLLYDFVGFNNFSGTNSAILVTGNASGFNINSNNIYQTSSISTQTFGSAFTLTGIKVNLNNSPSSFTISGNFIGGGAPQCLGNAWEIGPVNEQNVFVPIEVTVLSTSNFNISNNTIRNIFLASSIGFFGSTSFSGIKFQSIQKSTNVTIGNNAIGRDTGSSSINILNEGGTLQQVSGIQVDAPDTSSVSVTGNSIGGFTLSGTTNNDGLQFFGILMSSSGVVQNNLIGSLTSPTSIQINTPGANTSQSIIGICNSSFPGFASRTESLSVINNTVSGLRNNFSSPSSIERLIGLQVNDPKDLTIQGNTIQNLTANSPATNESVFVLKGIQVNNSSATNASSYNINSNIIRNLSNTNSNGLGNTVGLEVNNISGNTTNIGRNFIHSFNMSTTNNSARMLGILLLDGECQLTNNKIRLGITSNGLSIATPIKIASLENSSSDLVQVWHNTFYVGGSLASSASNTFCVNKSGNGAMDVTNNILVNARSFTASSISRNFCIGLGSTSLYSGNNNCYFKSGNGSSLGLIGTTAYDTIITWRTATSVESASGLVNPNLINPTGNSATLDLHVISPTPIESNGASLSTVLVDFDGQNRSNLTPNDVGADAGNFTTLPLPVVWKDFTATKQDKQAIITFSVSQQINNGLFEVERSTDGLQFSSIKTFEGDGNSSIVKSYTFEDQIGSFIETTQTLYYRIKQTDFNGEYSYSVVRKISLIKKEDESVPSLVLYPNPTENVITLSGLDGAEETTVSLFDYSGIPVKEIVLHAGMKETTIDLSSLPSGYYFVMLNNNSKRYKISKL